MELYEELFIRDNKISKLEQHSYELIQQVEALKNTVETLMRVKCKRGESNVSLNTDLITCLFSNKANMNIERIEELSITHKKEQEIAVSMLLNLLIGDDKHQVPCVLLDPHTVLYRRFNTYNASSIEEFAAVVYEAIQDQMCSMISLFESQDIHNVSIVVSVLNLLMHETSFTECFRKALKKYSNS